MAQFKKVIQKHWVTKKQAFSLIEVLVAMTILSVIVLIVAGIFQQTGLAWSLGLRRADEQSMIRAVAGSLTRDLSTVVDPANFICGEVGSDSFSEDVVLDKNSFGFWILKPETMDFGKNNQLDSKRELAYVEYKTVGEGIERTISFTKEQSNDLDSSASTSSKFTLGKQNGSVTFEVVAGSDFSGYESSFYDHGGIMITISPAVPISINDYEIAVGSCGPDGEWGTEDDIRTWVEGEDNN